MHYIPIFINLGNQPILIIGGGLIALRKIKYLIKSNANITIIAPNIHKSIYDLSELYPNIKCYKRCYEKNDLNNVAFVWIATSDKTLNNEIATECIKNTIWFNQCNLNKQRFNFIIPAILQKGDIQIAISSNGKSPIISKYIRQLIELILPTNLSLLSKFIYKKKNLTKNIDNDYAKRTKFWNLFIHESNLNNIQTNSELEQIYNNIISNKKLLSKKSYQINNSTNLELLTVKDLRQLYQAEIILYTNRNCTKILNFARKDALLIEAAREKIIELEMFYLNKGKYVVILD